ncbi:putative leucine-rich repeat receptor-like protein kinase At2g19210 [Nicotiana tabacum]|uniref:Leucine-rich repeat receptor-like protein kinase At2g19210 n=1 Tax=Nicotiana tabacum TaxID=4097 RepID=A0A1S3XVD2_TOBAC|nr:putative leucine-rich repeat receptor-like protein kinase At2g19210 [Nicotiana tomentosiformis]XP_016443830.1 PREDICTED: putative leucine-rich repeat receptor-like protein kinase At2g19210 [Nicotiana tabacum]
MEMLKGFLFACLVGCSIATIAVAQDDQSGFISIDCGIPAGSNYTDVITSISYLSDEGYVTGGVSNTISPIYQSNSLEIPFFTVTSFPLGTKNCYTLNPAQGNSTNYLIRASFFYGNYDGSNQLPNFDLYLGEDYWDTVTISNASIPTWKEVIHTPSTQYITVCLVKTDTTTPFISALELRPLNVTTYPTLNKSLNLIGRLNFGSLTNLFIRFPNDAYDRIWLPYLWETMATINTTQDVVENSYRIPSAVMSTAVTPDTATDTVSFSWLADNTTDKYYIYLHFAEVVELLGTQTREFNIYINDNLFYGPLSPAYLSTTTIFTLSPGYGSERYDVVINKTATSTLSPLINAVEIYIEM